MKKTIALCGVGDEIIHTLKCCNEYRVLCFLDERESRGDVKLAYFLQNDPSVALAIVGYPSAKGLAACDYLRTQDRVLSILWLCDCIEFEPEARRIGVNFYGTDSPNWETGIPLILRQSI